MQTVISRTNKKVEEGFAELIRRISPSYSEPDGAEASLNQIERHLRESHEMLYTAPYGSTGHGTNVDGESALDCFAVIPKHRVYEDSGKTLEDIRSILQPRFPDACITEGRPVIEISFGERRADCHHVVPAYPVGMHEEFDIFGMPGPSNRWIEICPGAHSAWINLLDEKCGHRLKGFVRIVKMWNYANGAPIWPFYLEICAADFLSKEGVGGYAADMQEFFNYMLRRRFAPFRKKDVSSEPIYGTTLDDKFDAMSPIRAAAEKAKNASFGARRGNTADAYFWWRKLFNYRFPAY